MIYDWYMLFSLPEFLATGLVSKTIDVVLDGVGEKEILVTRGNEIGIQYDDVFMMIDFEGRNPLSVQGDLFTYAVYKDSDHNIWLGIGIEP
jgi:hypothetical protein